MTPPSSNRITGFALMLASLSEGVFCYLGSGYHRAACACKHRWLLCSAFPLSSGFSSLCTPSLRLTDFDEALHADRSEASFSLQVLVESVETLAIAIDLEVDDDPGYCFQKVHDCPNVAIGGPHLPLDLLHHEEACLVEGRIDVPGRIRLGPLWRRPLQEFNEARAVLLGSPLQGKERPSWLEAAVHFPWTKGDRPSERQVKGVVCKGEASVGPLSLWLRATRIRTGGIGPDDLDSKRSQPSGGLRAIGRIGFRGHCHLGERS